MYGPSPHASSLGEISVPREGVDSQAPHWGEDFVVEEAFSLRVPVSAGHGRLDAVRSRLGPGFRVGPADLPLSVSPSESPLEKTGPGNSSIRQYKPILGAETETEPVTVTVTGRQRERERARVCVCDAFVPQALFTQGG